MWVYYEQIHLMTLQERHWCAGSEQEATQSGKITCTLLPRGGENRVFSQPKIEAFSSVVACLLWKGTHAFQKLNTKRPIRDVVVCSSVHTTRPRHQARGGGAPNWANDICAEMDSASKLLSTWVSLALLFVWSGGVYAAPRVRWGKTDKRSRSEGVRRKTVGR